MGAAMTSRISPALRIAGAAPHETLRDSERHFQLLVQGVKEYAIFMLDPEGRIATWNSGAERIKGYRAEEIIGEHFSRFYTEEDKREDLPMRSLQQAVAEDRYEGEGWRIPQGRQSFPGERRDRSDTRRRRQGDRLCESHARRHGTALGAGNAR